MSNETTTEAALEPTLEDLAVQAAALLDSLPTYVSDNTIRHAQQIAFALREGIKNSHANSRIPAPSVAPTLDSMWEALKAACCKNPAEAKLAVFVSEKKFKDALAPFAAPSVAPVVDNQPHCWHCGTVLESAELKLRCDRCPADCDDELCNAFGCAPQDAAPASPAALPDEADRACPCLHGEPCQKRCTCVNPHSSTGCWFCCTYGSPQQQRDRAATLRRMILSGIECQHAATTPPSTLAKAAAEEIQKQFSNYVPHVFIDKFAAIIERCISGGGEDK